ncbi:FISUMP domain-containing protein [Fibrobacter sp.]|uniref:FISUMP domain-containing protein n=1 Tax=Fibrobacter sp. TaxID=35828 RepID=UPI003865D10B
MPQKYGLFVLLFIFIALLAACGSDSTSSTNEDNRYKEVKNADNLGDCSEENEGDSVYVASEKMYVTCHNGFWSEFTPPDTDTSAGKLNIYVAADDTIPSLSKLYSCTYSYDGWLVFIASLNSYMLCEDYEWIEYKPKSSSSGAIESSDDNESYSEESSSSRRAQSSSSHVMTRDEILGPCTMANNGAVAMDSLDEIRVSGTDYYICRSGLWISADTYDLNTHGWSDTTDGAFREGLWSTFYFKSVSEECVTEEDSYTYQVYVYDRGWRVAKREELCYGKACTAMSGGESIIWNGRTYVCSDTAWRQENVYILDKSSFFASDVVYGSLTDERDGQVYKTVKIGTQVWMAENLNYADSLKDVVLQDGASFCYDNNDDNCAVGGRFYRWAAAMGLLSKYNNSRADTTLLKSSNHRGLCPEGWHIPDTTEWNTLIATVGKGNASALKTTSAWLFDADSIGAATNSTGFSAAPTGVNASSGANSQILFCSTYQTYSDEFRYFSLSYSSNQLYYGSRDKEYPCFVRCLQDDPSAIVDDPVEDESDETGND